MAARAKFSKSDAIIFSLSIASVVIVFVIVVAMPRSHDNQVIKREVYAQEPYRFPNGAAEKCVELWFRPPPDHPGEEVMALCDALLLKIFDYIKGRNDLISPLMEAAVKEERFENNTEEARDKMEEARIFHSFGHDRLVIQIDLAWYQTLLAFLIF